MSNSRRPRLLRRDSAMTLKLLIFYRFADPTSLGVSDEIRPVAGRGGTRRTATRKKSPSTNASIAPAQLNTAPSEVHLESSAQGHVAHVAQSKTNVQTKAQDTINSHPERASTSNSVGIATADAPEAPVGNSTGELAHRSKARDMPDESLIVEGKRVRIPSSKKR